MDGQVLASEPSFSKDVGKRMSTVSNAIGDAHTMNAIVGDDNLIHCVGVGTVVCLKTRIGALFIVVRSLIPDAPCGAELFE
jgi:hypothetical protein